MINIIDKKDCCGCRACANACPMSCIEMKPDEFGFFYASADTEKCVDCGRCDMVCPMMNRNLNMGLEYYIGYSDNKEIRHNCASGGLFGTIADYVLEQGGVVIGSAFDKELKLKATIATCKEELLPIYGSKYLQSNMDGIYQTIKELLEVGRVVFFCSVPCTIQACRNYLGKDYDNLYLMDIVCHGVSSQDFFDQSIEWWKKKGIDISTYAFRSKNPKINCSRVFRTDTMEKPYLNDPYYFLYLTDYVSFRDSCYNCPFATDERPGDVTGGDFYEPEKYFPGEDRLWGFSSIIANTGKGLALLNKLNMNKIKVDHDTIVSNNGCLSHPTHSKHHEEFMEDAKKIPFDQLIKKYGFYDPKTRIRRMYYHLPIRMQKILRSVIVRNA